MGVAKEYAKKQKSNKYKKEKSKVTLKETLKSAPYLIPAMISVLIFTVLQILYTRVISFTNYTMFTQAGDIEFVGFDNFGRSYYKAI